MGVGGDLEFLPGASGREGAGIQRLQDSVEHHGEAGRRQGCFQRAQILSGVISVKTLNTVGRHFPAFRLGLTQPG